MRTGQVWSEESKNEQNDVLPQDSLPAVENAERVVPTTRQDASHGELRALAALLLPLTLAPTTAQEAASPAVVDAVEPALVPVAESPAIVEVEQVETSTSGATAALLGLVGAGWVWSQDRKTRRKSNREIVSE